MNINKIIQQLQPIEVELELENECLMCGNYCEKEFCSHSCAIQWIQE